MSEASSINSKSSSRINTRTLVCTAMLCAIAYAVLYLSKTIFAPMAVAGFLKFDMKDVIIAIGGFLFGPLNALCISVVVSLIEMVTVSSTGPWGLLMNILSTCAFICPAAYFYKKRHTFSSAVIGLVIGGVFMTAVMLLWNYLITPIYMGQPREVIKEMLVPVFLPFNLVKALMNGSLTMLLYKPVVTALRSAHLAPESTGADGGSKGRNIGIAIVSLVGAATAVLLGLVLAKVI